MACYERTEQIIYVARSGTLVACIFYLYVTTVSEPNLLVELESGHERNIKSKWCLIQDQNTEIF